MSSYLSSCTGWPISSFVLLWAERSVVKNKMLESFSFARVHVATNGKFGADVGFGSL